MEEKLTCGSFSPGGNSASVKNPVEIEQGAIKIT